MPTLAVLFFCSGVSALIYQVLWLRVLGWVFGVTVFAASTVWASFMAGLALGSAQGFHDFNVQSFDQLLGAFNAGPEELRAFVGPGPLLTDDKPVVEYFMSLPRDRDVDISSLKGDMRRYVVEP